MNRTVARGFALAAVVFAAAGCNTNPPVATAGDSMTQTSGPATGVRARAKVHTELASLYFQNGNMAVALEELRTAMNADPEYAPAFSLRGLVHMYLREDQAADQSFRQALSLAPGDPEINNNYGWFLCQTGRERESFAFFTAAIKNPLYQTPEKSYVNAGVCALKANDLAVAEDYLQKALRYGRNQTLALLPMAELQYRRGFFDEARRLTGEYHRQAEPTAESLWLALRAERRTGDRNAEASLGAQLRRRFPDSREALELKRGNFE